MVSTSPLNFISYNLFPLILILHTILGAPTLRNGSKKSVEIAKSLFLLSKFKMILNYLIQGGALLSHVNAIDLLKLSDYLIIQEVEIEKIEGKNISFLNNRTYVHISIYMCV
jgi:hypothetical protein